MLHLTKNVVDCDLLELELELRQSVLEVVSLTKETSPLLTQWIETYIRLNKEEVDCTPCEIQRLNLLKSVLFDIAGEEIYSILKSMKSLVETLEEIGVFS